MIAWLFSIGLIVVIAAIAAVVVARLYVPGLINNINRKNKAGIEPAQETGG